MNRTVRYSLLPKLWRLTEAFEGSASGVAAGNFDGQILSWGALQWNIGQGTLRPLLIDIIDSSQEAHDIFGEAFRTALEDDSLFAEFARRNILDDHGRVVDEWQDRFQRVYRLTESKEVMMVYAEPYLSRATTYAIALGLHTERALALCFDLCIQNGSVDYGDFLHYIAEMSDHEDIYEWQRLKGLGVAMAKGSNPKWFADVRSRKVTIAVGEGEVHGQKYVLERDFGIRYYADREQQLLALWYE